MLKSLTLADLQGNNMSEQQTNAICQGCWSILGKVYAVCPDCKANLHISCADDVEGTLYCVGCAKPRRSEALRK